MELKNEFQTDAPIDRIWEVFQEVERIAPCLPGAQLEEVEGDEYRGIVKVKVGPITTQYKGVATFLEKDEAGRKIVIKAEGRDTKGAGNASATITVQLTEVSDAETKVLVSTDLSVTGKVAQFGRGVMGDISSKLMEQFAGNLSELLKEGTQSKDEQPKDEQSSSDQPKEVKSEEPEAVDILAASSSRMVKFFGSIAGFFYGIYLGAKKLFKRKS